MEVENGPVEGHFPLQTGGFMSFIGQRIAIPSLHVHTPSLLGEEFAVSSLLSSLFVRPVEGKLGRSLSRTRDRSGEDLDHPPQN